MQYSTTNISKNIISKMKKISLLLLSLTFLIGCIRTETEYSDVLHERAVVVTLIYSPSEHKTELTNTAYSIGNNDMIGTDYSGNTGIRIGKNCQITSTTIPEKYGVVFQCQHGTFTVEGSDQKYKVLHDKLNGSVRDTVDILYKEMYSVTYEDKNKDGKDEITSKVLQGLDFIDAQSVKK
jgi:hypothetical protein